MMNRSFAFESVGIDIKKKRRNHLQSIFKVTQFNNYVCALFLDTLWSHAAKSQMRI